MLNKESLDLIKSFEGLELKAYKDPVGVWTIGYGHTSMAGDPQVFPGLTLTSKEAENLLRKDLVRYENGVSKNVTVPLTENQYGALVSFVYNLGEGNFRSSTLLKKVNRKDFTGAALEFAKWNKADGKVLKGLTRRRAAEAALFSKASSSAVQPIPDDPGVIHPSELKDSVEHSPGYSEPATSFIESLLKLLATLFGGKK